MLPSYNAAPIPSQANAPLIEVTNVIKTYTVGNQKIQALAGISLQIQQGEFIALTGASGSGKSTLLQLLGCLDKPTSGSIRIAGQEATRLSDARLSSLRQTTIGFVFQAFYLQPFLKLDKNIAVPAMFKGTKPKQIQERVVSLLSQVGLSDRSQHYPREISGGQQQRAAIARALINKPSILLADEPTGNLDAANSKAIIDLFQTIRSQFGTTIIVVTHNPDIARQADRTLTLHDGVIV